MKKILIVDDDASVREMIMRGLELLETPFEFEFAENGSQACARIGRRPPDLVILDMMMPGMDGYQVLENLKNTESARDIPVLVVTGWGNDGKTRKPPGLKTHHILRKPFIITELQKTTIRLLKLEETNKRPE